MVDLAPAVDAVLTPTPGHLADILHVELSVGDRESTTYGTDTYGSWDYGGKYAWVRWDCDITNVHIVRGKQTMLERNSPGVCNFTAVQIVPSSWFINPPSARPGRVVTNDGRVVFEGIIEAATLSREYGHAEWSVTIVDDLARLGRLEVPNLVRPLENLTDRINALLTLAGMPPTSEFFSMFVQAVNGSGRKILDEMAIAVDTWRFNMGYATGAIELGSSPIVDRTGAFRVERALIPNLGGTGNAYDNYRWPWRISPTPHPTSPYNARTWIGDCLSIELSADVADVRNYLTYANTGGVATVSQVPSSVATYGTRSYQRMDLIGADGGGFTAVNATDGWHVRTSEPNPAVRIKSIVLDCWNRPTGSVPLINLLADMDATHLCEVFLPDQDDAGGDIRNKPITAAANPHPATTGSFIFGITWDLSDQEALLTLAMDCPIIRIA